MAALSESQVVALELEKVKDTVPVLYERDDVFYATIEKRPAERVSKRDMRVPMELSPGGRFRQFSSNGGGLGRGSAPEWDKALVNTFEFEYAVEWTRQVEYVTDDNRKAVLNVFRRLLSKSMAEFRRYSDSLMMTAGNGVLGTVTTVVNSGGKDTITMTTDGYGVRLLRKKQFVSFWNSTLTTLRTVSGGTSSNDEAEIDLYDVENKTIRVNATVASLGAGDKVVVGGLSDEVTPISIQGVPYHYNNASTGVWLGFDRATNPEIRANRVDAAGGGFDVTFPRIAMNKVGNRGGNDKKFNPTAWMHPCQIQAYEAKGQLVSVIQKQPKEESLNLYFNENMQMAGAGVRKHFSWDKTRIDFIINDIWGRAEMYKPGFYEIEGRKLFEVRDADGGVNTTQIFYITAGWNAYIDNPTLAVYISSLEVPSGY